MRTTLAIDDDVLAAARSIAADQRRTVGEVISELARKSLGHGEGAGQIRNGVLLLPVRPDGRSVSTELVNRLMDELPQVRRLLDVNVLIALIDPRHVFHDRAHRWFLQVGRACWASCPMTENGLLRIVGHGRYPNSPGSPAAVVASLQSLRQLGDWQFWPDDLSLTDSELIDANRLASSAQVTDTYLLALAVAQGGELATFDARLVTTAVKGGDRALHLIA